MSKEVVSPLTKWHYERLTRRQAARGELTQEYIDEISWFYKEMIEMSEEEIQVYVAIMTTILEEHGKTT